MVTIFSQEFSQSEPLDCLKLSSKSWFMAHRQPWKLGFETLVQGIQKWIGLSVRLAQPRELSLNQLSGHHNCLLIFFESCSLWVFSCPFIHALSISSINHLLNLQLQPKTHKLKLPRLSFHFPVPVPVHLWELKSYLRVCTKCGLTWQTPAGWNTCLTSSPFLSLCAGGTRPLWLTLLPGDANFLCVSMSRAAFVSASMFMSQAQSEHHFTQCMHVLNCFCDVTVLFPPQIFLKGGHWTMTARS